MSIIDGYELDDLRDKAARTERAEAAMENKAIVTRELKAEIERLHGIEKAALEAANIYETEIERLRTALATVRIFIEGEGIANAIVVPEGAAVDNPSNPSLLKLIDGALDDEQEAQPDTKLMPGMDAKIEDWGQ